MTGATSGAGTAFPSGAPEFTLGFLLFNGVHVTQSILCGLKIKIGCNRNIFSKI
jgi:hypothetical protein